MNNDLCNAVLVSLPLTGERTVPGVPHENYWFRRHEAAYRDCARRIAPSGGVEHILDAGASEGFGAALLRERTGAAVTALDYDEDASVHARQRYDLPAVRGNLVAMPFGGPTFDAVVSMQTIEHLWNQAAFLTECARILRPGGLLVLTTPNRLTFPPGNFFHTREFDATQLAELIPVAELIPAPFRVEHRLGVHHGPRLAGSPRIVDDQLVAEPHEWPDDLTVLVAGVTAADFVVTADVERSLDLYFVARLA